MDFVRSHFGKMQLWPVEHFFLHKTVPVVLYYEGVHFSEVTSYKIHTLVQELSNKKIEPKNEWNYFLISALRI